MSTQLEALRSSVEHLRAVVQRIDPTNFESPAYPTEWSIADVLSHIGSGAVILTRRFDDIVGDRTTDEGFNQSVWDEWNAKTPAAQVHEALIADGVLVERLESITDHQRDQFRFSMGPMDLDFAGFVGLRLNEQALHTWDVEVTLDPAATLPREVAGAVIDNLAMIVRFSGTPSGEAHALRVRTLAPSRDFILSLGADSSELSSSEADDHVDLEIPAESFVRLVYGRLDPSHTPSVVGDHHLDELRRNFPGF